MSQIWWIRHGPTHAKAMIGWTDLPADLSDTGRIARLAARLPEAPVVSSDLTRAVATADALAGARPRLPNAPALREMHFGDWEGLTHREAEAKDPDLIYALWDAPGDVMPPGGESWNALRARVDHWVDAHIAAAEGRPLVAVAHFGVILTQLQRALGVSAREVFAHKIDPLSLTCLELGATGWRADVINDPS